MTQFIFSWENLSESVIQKSTLVGTTSYRKKIILDDVSGAACSGTLIAILGTSGSGKTTLLSLLSGQRKGKNGVLKINGKPISLKIMRHNSEFMQQKDVFINTLNVYEHLQFMAAMCLKRNRNERTIIVQRLLKHAGLDLQKYVKIKYLSGGEKRKLSLASKLLTDPYILFCDEPTTGVDSFSAITIVKLLSSIAATGKIVFLTVHQPSSQLFNLFDNIILLSGKGSIVFQGTKENANCLFERSGFICPESYNPADFYIKCLVDSDSYYDKAKILQETYNKGYKIKYNFEGNGYNGIILKYRDLEKPFFFELYWLTWRTFIDMFRRKNEYLKTFLLTMVTALMIASIYISVTLDTAHVQGIQGALLLIVSELIFGQMYQVAYTFPGEIEIFAQEKMLYSSFPYYLSKMVSLIPFCVLSTVGYLTIYFAILPFLHSTKLYFIIFVILLVTTLGGSSLGLCLSALFPSIETLNLFSVPFEVLCLTLSGMWIKVSTLPKVFGILKYFSPFYMSYESVCIAFWTEVTNLANCTGSPKLICYRNGSEVLKKYDFKTTSSKIDLNLLYLLGLIAVYCYIGYIGILRKRALYTI